MMETKIIVIEDEIAISEAIKSFFESEGYDVKVAADGSEGINYFKMYDPDITVLDITLPKKDGWQVCREIRESSQKPIIMISTKGEVFDKVLGLALGIVLGLLSASLISTALYSVIELVAAVNSNSDIMNLFNDSYVFKFMYNLKMFDFIRSLI
jgi:CheY-like chemotaxis protein